MSSHIAQYRFAMVAAGLLALGLAGAGPVAAQQSHPMLRIAIPDSFPTRSQVPALLVRSGTDPLNPVILLNKAKLDEETIAAAIAAVDVVLRKPIEPSQTQVIGISTLEHARPMSGAARARAEGYLKQLRTRPVSMIGNIGPGRWIQVSAPGH